MKIAYLHNLPLEYYPPATNTLDLLGRSRKAVVRVFTTQNSKQRTPYENSSLSICRTRAPDPAAIPLLRLMVAIWWHVRTAFALFFFKPDAVIYVEPHSAIAAYLYYRLLGGGARLFIHHHEYYAPEDYLRPGMRLPRFGSRLEASYLFPHAVWISQTNEDRLRMVREHHPDISESIWRLFPNYPPKKWARERTKDAQDSNSSPLRLIYVGSASFQDTYIEEVTRWAASHNDAVQLHISGYNITHDVQEWLETELFANVTFDAGGYDYDDLPGILADFHVGLVLYKGNTTNFVYNVPNKVFEYLICGLDVWYPVEMKSMRGFKEENPDCLLELDFSALDALHPEDIRISQCHSKADRALFCAESAIAPFFLRLGVDDVLDDVFMCGQA